jgi:hypothetical protein
VRHSKSLGPLPWLWDRNPWELTPTSVPQLQLGALLEALPAGADADARPQGRRAGRRRTAARCTRGGPELPVLVCARWWPSVDAHAGVEWVRPVLSARNRGGAAPPAARVRAGRRRTA